jgi:hypothetical protein
MTELYIDSQPAVLPPDFSLKVKQQNPFFTKNGAFTLELTLSLKDKINQRLYSHMNRLQSAPAIKGRSAHLIADGRTILNGTEIVLSNTDEQVNIQLVSGNSELNWFIHQEKDIEELYISDLDLGEEPELTAQYLNSILTTKYPEAAFAPARIWTGDIMINGFLNLQIASPEDPIPFINTAIQPYLLTLLIRTVQTLGYNITQNDLLSDQALCRLFILNDIRDNRYNRLLPGWTVREFLEACEKFLNITFDINPEDRSVRIVKNTTGVTVDGQTHLKNVSAEYQRNDAEDENNLTDYENVRYPLPEDTWYKYQAISSDIMAMAEIITYATYTALANALTVTTAGRVPDAIATDYYKTLKAFYVTEDDTTFIIDRIFYDNGQYIYYWYYLRPINRFGAYHAGETQDREATELPFAPAQFADLNTALTDIPAHHNIMPALDGDTVYNEEETPEETADLTQLIENGIPDEEAVKKDVFLAFYTGSLPGYARTDSAIDFMQEIPLSFGKYESTNLFTLRLQGPAGWAEKYYKANHNYNFQKEYTIHFLYNTTPDVRTEFVIEGKRFLCKELEYTVNAEGIFPEITGIFYPVED